MPFFPLAQCTKAGGETEKQTKDVNQGDNLSCHSFNEADFQVRGVLFLAHDAEVAAAFTFREAAKRCVRD